MIKKRGNLFDTHAAAIGHGVNVRGVMGAGIAVEFKKRFPKNYKAYHNACVTGLFRAGETYIYQDNGIYVTNIAAQDQPGANATYKYLMTAALDAALELTDFYDQSLLAIPQIGCGIGGLEWNGVEYILKAVEVMVPGFEFEVWKL